MFHGEIFFRSTDDRIQQKSNKWNINFGFVNCIYVVCTFNNKYMIPTPESYIRGKINKIKKFYVSMSKM